ncbi:hypothetical protein [Methanolapillus ohkumae]|uniref:Uncharacterized protein n=1 Tax=Methanolapillus ohkumae TaxID=3028298 RepID=A0AA96ZXH6_9EURY|nr:hypothetical protein MsAm2_08520 [Methanosarcinaceae archaeon Am2]
MKKFIHSCLFILTALFCFSFLTGLTLADSSEENITSSTSEDPNLLRITGKEPTEEEAAQYWPILDSMVTEIHDEKLLMPRSKCVNGIGASTSGYFMIAIRMDCNISEEELDRMVTIITNIGKEHGIENVPIIIRRIEDGANGSLNLSDNQPAEKDGSPIPSFTLFMGFSVFAALIFIFHKRK